METLGRNEWNLLVRRLLPTVEADYCAYLLLLVDTDADGRVNPTPNPTSNPNPNPTPFMYPSP